jgi:hypothetical protein
MRRRIVLHCTQARQRNLRLTLPRATDGTLLRVDLELQTALDKAGDTRHHPMASRFAANVDVAVIRVPHKPVATPP